MTTQTKAERLHNGNLQESEFYKVKGALTVLTELPLEDLRLIIDTRQEFGTESEPFCLILIDSLSELLMND